MTPQRLRTLVVVVGTVSFVAMSASLLVGEVLTEPSSTGVDSYGRDATSHEVFVDLLTELGYHVHRLRHPTHTSIRGPLIFVEPSEPSVTVRGRELQLDEIVASRNDQGLVSIVILPKWTRPFAALGDTEVSRISRDRVQMIADAVVGPGSVELDDQKNLSHEPVRETIAMDDSRYSVELPSPQMFPVANAMVLATGSTGEAFAVTGYEDDGVVLVSDPDIVHNFNIQRGQNAAFITDILAPYVAPGGSVTIDEVFHGHGMERSLAAALRTYPTYLVVMHFLGFLLLLAWYGVRRNMPPVQPTTVRARSVDELLGLASLLLARGELPFTLSQEYARTTVRGIARDLRLADTDPILQARAIDALAVRRGVPGGASALLSRTGPLGRSRESFRAALRLARDAYGLRQRLTRTRDARRIAPAVEMRVAGTRAT